MSSNIFKTLPKNHSVLYYLATSRARCASLAKLPRDLWQAEDVAALNALRTSLCEDLFSQAAPGQKSALPLAHLANSPVGPRFLGTLPDELWASEEPSELQQLRHGLCGAPSRGAPALYSLSQSDEGLS